MFKLLFNLIAIIPVLSLCNSAFADLGVPAEMLADAGLHDVYFHSARRGIAVGDRGLILATEDGGRSWSQRISGVFAPLYSISFADKEHGWIVGGEPVTGTNHSQGVVLQTTDGGKSWFPAERHVLPALHEIHAISSDTAIAVGEANGLYPSGIMQTTSGGRSWAPVASTQSHAAGWQTADFQEIAGSRQLNLLAGRDGALAELEGGRLRKQHPGIVSWRPIRKMRFQQLSCAWLVGDAGLVMNSKTGGASWSRPASLPPEHLLRQLDFQAFAASGENIWIAGAPGSVILHSPDGGKSWQWQQTQQTLPLTSLFFLDARQGWAVGALGTILSTSDGGRHWQTQRAGAQRAALLAMHSDVSQVPLEMIARTGANDGMVVAVEIVQRTSETELQGNPGGIVQKALLAAGAAAISATDRFPARDRRLQLAADKSLLGVPAEATEEARAAVLQYLVGKIRQWRPEVIVTDSTQGGSPQTIAFHALLLEAVADAAQPSSCPDQIETLGLKPWQVNKVFSPADAGGGVILSSSQLAPRLGKTLGNQTMRSRALLNSMLGEEQKTGYRLHVCKIPTAAGRQDFFSGLSELAVGDCRRELGAPTGHASLLQQLAVHRRIMSELLDAGRPFDRIVWRGQVEELTQGLSKTDAAELLWQITTAYQRQGRSELAGEVMQAIILQYADTEMAEAATWGLFQLLASEEVVWRGDEKAGLPSGQPIALAAHSQWMNGSAEITPEGAVRFAGAEAEPPPAESANSPAQRLQAAWEIGQAIERVRPHLALEPRVQFAMGSLLRRSGRLPEAEKVWRQLAGNETFGWSQRAAAEIWLQNPENKAPCPVVYLPFSGEKPYLDGHLNETIWKNAEVILLKSRFGDDEAWPAEVKIARDESHLYLAVTCQKGAGCLYEEKAKSPRRRDDDVSKYDRVDFLFDVDRDGCSYFRFTVDQRGCTTDSAAGDSAWNPAWFVASQQNSSQWVVEAAIPFSQAGLPAPTAGGAWSLGVSRTIPRAGFQSWSWPASLDATPAGFGLMVFEAEE